MVSTAASGGFPVIRPKSLPYHFIASVLLWLAAATVVCAQPPAPTQTSITPASGPQGGTVPVTLTGTNFVAGAGVEAIHLGFLGTGSWVIPVSGVSVVSSTEIAATFTIPANAGPGAANVIVDTAGGSSQASIFFTVYPPPPALTSVSPASGPQGGSVPVTLTGTNFVAGATIATSNPGITVSGVSVVSATQITATFTIAANAALGAANVTVTNGGGTSGAVSFTVSP